jgi:membrane-bound inhibitor of C-type lysozyme
MTTKHLSFISVFLTKVLIIFSLSSTLNAQDISIYRWVDKNNVVHFSQNLPKDNDYKDFSTVSSYKALSKADREALAEERSSAKLIEQRQKQQDTAIAKNREVFQRNCKAAQLNIKMLNSSEAVYISEENSDGSIENRSLTAEEKIAKLTLSKEQETLYCGE